MLGACLRASGALAGWTAVTPEWAAIFSAFDRPFADYPGVLGRAMMKGSPSVRAERTAGDPLPLLTTGARSHGSSRVSSVVPRARGRLDPRPAGACDLSQRP